MSQKLTKQQRIERILAVIAENSWGSREAVQGVFDERGVDWESIEGIGPVLAPTMRKLMKLEPQEWRDQTHLPYWESERNKGHR